MFIANRTNVRSLLTRLMDPDGQGSFEAEINAFLTVIENRFHYEFVVSDPESGDPTFNLVEYGPSSACLAITGEEGYYGADLYSAHFSPDILVLYFGGSQLSSAYSIYLIAATSEVG